MKQQSMIKNNPYVPIPVKVIKKVKHSEDNFSLYVDWKLKYEPGQFAQVSVLGIGECPISFASYGKNYIEFNIHEIGSVTHALSKLRVGSKIWVRGPYGKGYPMKELEGKNLVFVGGGCGVAPLKGALEYVEKHRKKFGEVDLLMGFRSPEDILFEEQIEQWKKIFNIHLTVDRTKPESCYVGNVGFVTEELKNLDIKKTKRIAITCGPPIMMRKTIEVLQEKGFTDKQIYLSAERLMHCAFGKCGACMIRGKYTCVDGPVFRYDEIKDYTSD